MITQSNETENSIPSRPPINGQNVPIIEDSFWTESQRQGNSLQEVPYRACFKTELPEYFITRLTNEGDHVFDPFMGRGTTLVAAALHARVPMGCDINPLCRMLVKPRLAPPCLEAIHERLNSISWVNTEPHDSDLLAFYHPETLDQLLALRTYLIQREETNTIDAVDEWIRMAALTRLSGHSSKFFSVYTLPPNQATLPQNQRKINAKREQTPEPRDVPGIILRKSKQLMRDFGMFEMQAMRTVQSKAHIWTGLAENRSPLKNNTIELVVTSPPFLNAVDYRTDNWLRCWFVGIDSSTIQINQTNNLKRWHTMIRSVLAECHRVLTPNGHVVMEVGEIRKGTLKLEDVVVQAGIEAGLIPKQILINNQHFTKTSNCWGVSNNKKGTNTNRMVVFTK